MNSGQYAPSQAVTMHHGQRSACTICRGVFTKPPKRNPKYIPYPKMIQYIALMDDGAEKLAEFNKVRQASTAQTNPTQFVNDWFKSACPDYKKPVKKAS